MTLGVGWGRTGICNARRDEVPVRAIDNCGIGSHHEFVSPLRVRRFTSAFIALARWFLEHLLNHGNPIVYFFCLLKPLFLLALHIRR